VASSIFIWPGMFSSNGSAVTFATPLLAPDGTAAAPSYSFASDTNTGFYRAGSTNVVYAAGGAPAWSFTLSGFEGRSDAIIGWSSSTNPTAAADTALARAAANTLALRNGTNAQAFRPYGYISGSREGYGSVQTALGSVTLSGATTATSNIIPAGCFVIGVATTTTTTITGASGYTVGDGSDADRWGDITGTAVGTNSNNTNSTANPTGYVAAASAVTLTAKTSNFTGGVVQVVVFYLTTGSA
jgi:hypothetical protein